MTITDCGYRAPGTTSGDFRKLTPVVLRQALARADTVVCEPTLRARIEVPPESVPSVLGALAGHGASLESQSQSGALALIEAVVPAASIRELQAQLPGLSGGEGVMETEFASYRSLAGEKPVRRRTWANPSNRDDDPMQPGGRAVRRGRVGT